MAKKKQPKPQPKAEEPKASTPPDTVITITLPQDENALVTLLIRRGDLAHMRQFVYAVDNDMLKAINEAYYAIAAVEANPPVIPDLPEPKPEPKPVSKPAASAKPTPKVEQEPTIEIPLRKGKRIVKATCLTVSDGEPSEEAIRIAGRLIDGGLWDGKTPICIADVDAAARKMQYLNDKDLSLYELEDFAQVVEVETVPEGELVG